VISLLITLLIVVLIVAVAFWVPEPAAHRAALVEHHQGHRRDHRSHLADRRAAAAGGTPDLAVS